MVKYDVETCFEFKTQRWEVKVKEQLMKVKMISEALLKSKLVYSFELIYNHGLVPCITSLGMFLLSRPESLLLAGLAKSLVLKKYFCF